MLLDLGHHDCPKTFLLAILGADIDPRISLDAARAGQENRADAAGSGADVSVGVREGSGAMSSENIQWLDLSELDDHPKNPRLFLRDDVIDAIRAGLQGGFDPAHALLVRPLDGRYQVVSGHHRKAAARKAGLERVPCWARPMDDEEAEMALVTTNNQKELSPLEIGLHALHFVGLAQGKKGGGLANYAEKIGRAKSTVSELLAAARVAETCSIDRTSLADKTAHLTAIHALDPSCWPAIVDLMLEHGWSAKDTQAAVERVKSVLAARPAWLKSATPIARIAIEPSFAKTVLSALSTLASCWERLPEAATIYRQQTTDETKQIDGREYRRIVAEAADKDRIAWMLGGWSKHVEALEDGSVAATDAERKASEVRLRAERRTGELLKELARAQTSGLKKARCPTRPQRNHPHTPKPSPTRG